ncbi:hypothetical protein BDV41DRAFT_516872 [Aspergillus transmontanensis]|uniref:Uncharacterized protein n=1 Tax=Aspergillus transmontanensis TaxID=1034304 RepID=A0A5N6WH35_9EURO|nr:hypothetical protein BDV41DRAFT_516872 [Aspergillus transmontanensis]
MSTVQSQKCPVESRRGPKGSPPYICRTLLLGQTEPSPMLCIPKLTTQRAQSDRVCAVPPRLLPVWTTEWGKNIDSQQARMTVYLGYGMDILNGEFQCLNKLPRHILDSIKNKELCKQAQGHKTATVYEGKEIGHMAQRDSTANRGRSAARFGTRSNRNY